jgi:hypothetical protein
VLLGVRLLEADELLDLGLLHPLVRTIAEVGDVHPDLPEPGHVDRGDREAAA